MGDNLSLYRGDSFVVPGQAATSETGSMHNFTPWHNSRLSESGSRYNPPSEVSSSSRRSQVWGTGLVQHKDGRVTLHPPAEERVAEVSSSSRSEQACGTGLIQHRDGSVTLLPPTEERVIKVPPRHDNIGAPGHPSPEIVARMRGMHHPI